jgi:hypothetical protein
MSSDASLTSLSRDVANKGAGQLLSPFLIAGDLGT